MGQLIESLHRLQAIELKLATLRRQEEEKKRRVAFCRRQVEKVDERIAESRNLARTKQMQVDSLNLEVSTHEETLRKRREALAKAKTNKEYATILSAMNMEKADTSKIETSVIELLDEIQRINTQVEELNTERARLHERVTHAEGELAAFLNEHHEDLSQFQAERDLCAKDIPAATLSLFTRVAERHEGEAVVPVTRPNARREEYVCSGCNMKVTLEVVNSLRSRDDLQFCATCGRILYFEAAERAKAR